MRATRPTRPETESAKRAAISERRPIKSRAVAAGRNFPVPLGRASVGCGAELAFEFFEDRGAVALAASCAVETAIEVRFDADREDDPPHLHPHRKAEWVEVGYRPRQDLVTAIERHAEQMLDLLCRRPMAPAGRKVGHARHAREGDDAAVGETDALLALSFQRRACRGSGMWRMLGAAASEAS